MQRRHVSARAESIEWFPGPRNWGGARSGGGGGVSGQHILPRGEHQEGGGPPISRKPSHPVTKGLTVEATTTFRNREVSTVIARTYGSREGFKAINPGKDLPAGRRGLHHHPGERRGTRAVLPDGPNSDLWFAKHNFGRVHAGSAPDSDDVSELLIPASGRGRDLVFMTSRHGARRSAYPVTVHIQSYGVSSYWDTWSSQAELRGWHQLPKSSTDSVNPGTMSRTMQLWPSLPPTWSSTKSRPFTR